MGPVGPGLFSLVRPPVTWSSGPVPRFLWSSCPPVLWSARPPTHHTSIAFANAGGFGGVVPDPPLFDCILPQSIIRELCSQMGCAPPPPTLPHLLFSSHTSLLHRMSCCQWTFLQNPNESFANPSCEHCVPNGGGGGGGAAAPCCTPLFKLAS